jgi:molybdopterin molybdotransferase
LTSTQLVPFADALAIVLAHATALPQLPCQSVDLLASSGRVLAHALRADRDQPPFDRATRDGFAVIAEEFSSADPLAVVGLLRAGEAWYGGPLQPGTAIEIMTGAAVPAGATAIGMVEHAARSGESIRAAAGRTLQPSDNIVPRGSEARRGDPIVFAGTTLGAAEIALAAGCGCTGLLVYQRPTVGIVATGDELVEIDLVPADHQIRNSNSYALAALVTAAGGDPHRLPTARDTRESLRERIAAGRRSGLLLVSGGVSAGKYDLVEDILAEFDAEFFFTGVAMQPGKPVVFGRLPAREDAPERFFFGLPGNPISTQVTFHCFVQPLLRAMCGAGAAPPAFVQATLAESVRGKAGVTRLLPAHLAHDLPRPTVKIVPWQGSGDMAANARANCYALLPDGTDLAAGDVISVLLR